MPTVGTVLALAFLVFGGAQKHSQADEDDIHEAVLRYQINSWYEEEKPAKTKEPSTPEERELANRLNPLIVHISVNDTDPSPELLARFKDDKRLVRPASEANPKEMGKSHWPSGKIIFRSEKISWITSNHVKVEGGYYCGGLCAAGGTFDVRKKKGRWKVTRYTGNWIS